MLEDDPLSVVRDCVLYPQLPSISGGRLRTRRTEVQLFYIGWEGVECINSAYDKGGLL
jgi:hypothetical protein